MRRQIFLAVVGTSMLALVAGGDVSAKYAKVKRYKNIERLSAGLKSVQEALKAAQMRLDDGELSRSEREYLNDKIETCRYDEKCIKAEIRVVKSLGLDQEPIRPVSGRITSNFGMRFHPIRKIDCMHTGIDFAGPIGTPVKAAWGGEVIETGRRNGYGNVVVIDHLNGTVSMYGHLSSLNVDVGQEVDPGDKVGEIGMTGLATGPHLHFEIRVDGEPIDPLSFFK